MDLLSLEPYVHCVQIVLLCFSAMLYLLMWGMKIHASINVNSCQLLKLEQNMTVTVESILSVEIYTST